jgi:competence protein ComEA
LLPQVSAAVPTSSPPTTLTTTVVVQVVGAVVHPGVYRVPGDGRVLDAVTAAGGAAPGADIDRVNLAARVADGERIAVPRPGEDVPPAVSPDGGGASASATPAEPLDLNTATADQLDALPGVGPATAKAIIDERRRRGRFRSVDDLLQVRGIGPSKLADLKGLVRVGP